MPSALAARLLSLASRVGADRSDTEGVRLQKTLLTTATFAYIAAGWVWGALYLLLGQPLAAAIPWSYVALSALSLAAFHRSRRYPPFRFTQLLLILVLPFSLQLALGGFVNSSAVILWSLICPIGALLFAGPRQAIPWFAAYLGLLGGSGLVQPYLPAATELPSTVVRTFFVLNIGAISATVFVLLSRFMTEKDTAMQLLRAEQDKSEALLLNILPKEIAEILKEGAGTIADHYDHVTLLMADLVDFTSLAARLPPAQTVEMLNEIFTHFDMLTEEHGVEKIETVGDQYLAACGVPRRVPDHAAPIARMALEMSAYMKDRLSHDGRSLQMRIGIHSGPVVGGVIGRKKFAFDIFGDTVNTASRMQSSGLPGRIQITRQTYELLKDEFVCEPRGTIEVKGKGELETWFLLGERDHRRGG